ncbi:family 16 glycosylhydrolase [Nocardioides soli]|uniref:Beta-glucanase (GH16 family) n=1 Tax=Nocardioides soli TaxID=1036020 RepID=A0A7W4VVI9_9ACTN|nr:beta-glucanase (GH16 family) [Nocardioides soli]
MTRPVRATRARRPVAATLVVAATAALALAACSSDDKKDEGGGDGAAVQARLLPPLSDSGKKARPADRADVVVEGVVEPAAEGEKVTLQVRDGGDWSDLDTAKQDDDGAVTFSAPYLVDGEPQSYRLVTGDEHSDKLDTAMWDDRLDFSDEFEGDQLQPVWNQRLQGYDTVEARSCSKSDPSMVEVRDGVVELSVALDPERDDTCTYQGDEYAFRLNSNIGTQGSYGFQYGFAAARMKFHEKRGQHSAFWMQPSAGAATGDAAETGAEIDVIEWFGHPHHSGLASYVHYIDGGERVKSGNWIKDPERFGDNWWKRYHVFSVEWTPDGYTFRIDGQVTTTLDEGVSGVDQFLILSNLSSNYEFEHLPSASDLPQTTDVDWVRVWTD